MTRLRRLPPTICAFHLGFGLVLFFRLSILSAHGAGVLVYNGGMYDRQHPNWIGAARQVSMNLECDREMAGLGAEARRQRQKTGWATV